VYNSISKPLKPKSVAYLVEAQPELAEFLQSLMRAPAQWYSVVSLKDGVPSLCDLLETSNKNMLNMLTFMGFGTIMKTSVFRFKKENFENKILQNSLPCKLRHHTVVDVKGRPWFIRVGSGNMMAMLKPGTSTLPPRIHLLEDLRRKLKTG
jgi:hypothetical protein